MHYPFDGSVCQPLSDFGALYSKFGHMPLTAGLNSGYLVEKVVYKCSILCILSIKLFDIVDGKRTWSSMKNSTAPVPSGLLCLT